VTRATNFASTNWSGAVMTAHSGESFSTVSAEWVVPKVTQVPIESVKTTDISEWVGIDGFNSADVCQAGVMEVVHTSANGQQTITCSAWDEWYPAVSQNIPAASFHVKPGDTVSVTVETAGAHATEATFIFHDETTGKSYETSLAAPAGTSLVGNSAEVVVETPEWISGNTVSQPPLSDFVGSPIAFHDVSATYANGAAASLASAQSIGMWTNDIPAADGPYTQEAYGIVHPNSDSVTVIEDAYWTNASLYGSALLSGHYYF
jgi:Peptidase A4 family